MNIEGHKWPLFNIAGRGFAAAMLLVPRRWRFGAALLAAHAAMPLIRKTEAYREQRANKVDGDLEIALHFVLSVLTKSGVTFDPRIASSGYEVVSHAQASGKGVLVICPHAALSLFLARLFHDNGLEPVVITADGQMRVGGTRMLAQTLQPSPTFLVRTRNLLRGRRLICAMPDRARHQEGRTIEFETAAGPIIIAPALMRVAARCGAKVVFSEIHMEGRGMIATFRAPSPACNASADAITADFIEFVRAHIESRSRVKIEKERRCEA